MDTVFNSSRLFALAALIGVGLAIAPAHAAVIYSSENESEQFNDKEPGSGDGDYYYDMGNQGQTPGGPRVGGTFGAGGGINGAGGGGGGGGGGNFRNSGPSSFASFSTFNNENGDDPETPYIPNQQICTENCRSVPTENGDSSVDAPEPATLAVLGAGLMGLGLMRRRRRK